MYSLRVLFVLDQLSVTESYYVIIKQRFISTVFLVEEVNPCEVEGTERVDCGETEKQACLDKHCCWDASRATCYKYKGNTTYVYK